VGLLTICNVRHARVAMHAVRERVLAAQAEAAGLPLHIVHIPDPCSNAAYEAAMRGAMEHARDAGITDMLFGDLFLEDVRRYREEKLAAVGMTPHFPLWGRDTTALAGEMVAGGLRATITCVDPAQLDRRFAGRAYDADFLAELPAGVDPCGERGEFHSCVWAGPMFDAPLSVTTGDIVDRDGFVFADVTLDQRSLE
jgi:uncharacterized protein (TIGR00290 family)